MSAPEYRRLIERVRELVTQAEGQFRVIPVGRFAEDLPEGLPHGEQVLRTMPVTDFLSGQPRVEVLPIQLRPRLHAPTGSTQIRRVEIVLRVARSLPLDAIKDNDARYDQSGLAAEDGEVICKALEWPPNLEHTSEGLPTGCISLVHQASDSVVQSDAKGTGHPQILETLHRFAGRIFISEAAVAAPANVIAPTINVDGGGDPELGSELVGTPGVWTDAVLYRYQWLRDGVAIGGETSLRYTVAAADGGASITLRETAYGTGGSVSVESGAVAIASGAYDPSQEVGLLIDLFGDEGVHEAGVGILAWEDRGRIEFVANPAARPTRVVWRNGRFAVDFNGATQRLIGGRASQEIAPAGSSLTVYLFGELDTLSGLIDNGLIDFELGRLWLLFEVATTFRMGWFDTNYRSTGQASVGAHSWTWSLEHGANGECFEDGVSLGTAPFTGLGLGGAIAVGSVWPASAQGLDGKIGRLLVFEQLHDAPTRARVEAWGTDYYAL